jgi:hypothetical protein
MRGIRKKGISKKLQITRISFVAESLMGTPSDGGAAGNAPYRRLSVGWPER